MINLVMTIRAATSNVDKVNSFLREYTKLLDISSINCYFIALSAECIKETTLANVRKVYDCNVWWTEDSEVYESLASMRFQTMCVSIQKSNKAK